MNTNETQLPPFFEGLQSIWNVDNGDDVTIIDTEDDDTDYDIVRFPLYGAVVTVLVISVGICLIVIYCAARSERTGTCCGKLREEPTDEEWQSLHGATIKDIEAGLKLERWYNVEEKFQDEVADSVSNTSNGSTVFTSTEDNAETREAVPGEATSHILKDPKVAALAKKARCVLCSKVFTGDDVVSQSTDPTCPHHFHSSCIVPWLRKCDHCPVCKKPYTIRASITGTEQQAQQEESISSLDSLENIDIVSSYEGNFVNTANNNDMQESKGIFSGVAASPQVNTPDIIELEGATNVKAREGFSATGTDKDSLVEDFSEKKSEKYSAIEKFDLEEGSGITMREEDSLEELSNEMEEDSLEECSTRMEEEELSSEDYGKASPIQIV